jgi:hypothetical protein
MYLTVSASALHTAGNAAHNREIEVAGPLPSGCNAEVQFVNKNYHDMIGAHMGCLLYAMPAQGLFKHYVFRFLLHKGTTISGAHLTNKDPGQINEYSSAAHRKKVCSSNLRFDIETNPGLLPNTVSLPI